jgi:hypothetical protein
MVASANAAAGAAMAAETAKVMSFLFILFSDVVELPKICTNQTPLRLAG